MAGGKRLAVVGGGWAGVAAAIEATRRGHQATLFVMAPQLGGRSRGVDVAGMALDNGQHILI
ncbi:MAG: NAD(P)-binding protein, partial [Bacteriovorax sp.]|nr:NAD(P)-binding protein [Rhizobacter sp.]